MYNIDQLDNEQLSFIGSSNDESSSGSRSSDSGDSCHDDDRDERGSISVECCEEDHLQSVDQDDANHEQDDAD